MLQLGGNYEWELEGSHSLAPGGKKWACSQQQSLSVCWESVLKARSSQAKSYVFAPTFPVLSQGKSESREGESLPNLWEMRRLLLGMHEGWWYLIEELPNFPSGWRGKKSRWNSWALMRATEQQAGAIWFHFLKAIDLSNKMAWCHGLRMQLETQEASCLDSCSSQEPFRVF